MQFADTVRAVSSHCHEENADIDEDSYSGSSSENNGQRLGTLPPVGDTPVNEGETPLKGEETEPQFSITDTGWYFVAYQNLISIRFPPQYSDG